MKDHSSIAAFLQYFCRFLHVCEEKNGVKAGGFDAGGFEDAGGGGEKFFTAIHPFDQNGMIIPMHLNASR